MKRAIRAAVKLYRDFREKEPRKVAVVEFDIPEAVMVIGHVEEICYTTTHGKKVVSYRHPFQAGSRPLLVVSSDGKQLMLLGGRYKFTDRGIVDRDAAGRLVFDPEHGSDDDADADGRSGGGRGFLRRRQAD